MKKILALFILSLFSLHVHANIIIHSTRIVYPEGNKEVAAQLQNTGINPALVQAWLDDGDPESTPETTNVPFILTPPVVKIESQSGQQLRIKFTGGSLAKDRESLFYLNVLDIPPIDEAVQDKNLMQIAIRSRIKVFYRPNNLAFPVEKISSNTRLTINNSIGTLENNTPYYLNILALKENKKSVNLLEEGTMVPPYSQFQIPLKNTLLKSNKSVQLTIVNDYGSTEEITIPTN
nr:molecular chaperone [uncultured Moellerella sp.]